MRALFARQYRWQCWLDVEAALAAAEAEYGIIPVAAAEAIASAARLPGLDVARIQRGIAETSHPLMALVTELAMAAGEHGGWVHWGATTQNITQTGDVLVLREAHRKILRLLAGVLSAAADLAERTAGMLAAGRTHGQHAVPITFGFKPAGWIDELVRHVTRLRSAEGRVFTAMAGGAVGTFALAGPGWPPGARCGRGPAGPDADGGAVPGGRRQLRRVRVPARPARRDRDADRPGGLGLVQDACGYSCRWYTRRGSLHRRAGVNSCRRRGLRSPVAGNSGIVEDLQYGHGHRRTPPMVWPRYPG
jgi:hypothetical protein